MLPGIANLIVSLILLYYIDDPSRPFFFRNTKSKAHLIRWTGLFLIALSAVIFILWMIDVGRGNYTTKIHRALSMLLLPLGISMVVPEKPYTQSFPKNKQMAKDAEQYKYQKELMEPMMGANLLRIELEPTASLWKDFLPIYLIMNSVGYYDHHHSSMDMPTGEETSHTILCFLYFFSGLLFGVSRFLAILHEQTVLFVFGCIIVFVIGIWFIFIGIVLYGGAYGNDGVNYNDAYADFGIIVFVVSTAFMLYYICLYNKK